MSKTKFTETTPLTADHFNSFVQESQIVQGPGFNKNVVMSQAAVTAALNYLGFGYTGYGYGSGYGYGYGSSCTPAAKSNSVFYATGKLQDNLINACGDTPFHAEGPGTTVIVKMSDNYISQNGNARLRAGDIEKEIVVLSGTNGNAGIRKIYYNTSVPSGSNDIYSRNVFLKGASYEFYYDGQYWVLKNTVVLSGKNYKIWADGFVEQWGISGAASGLVKVKKEEKEFLLSWIDVFDYQ